MKRAPPPGVPARPASAVLDSGHSMDHQAIRPAAGAGPALRALHLRHRARRGARAHVGWHAGRSRTGRRTGEACWSTLAANSGLSASTAPRTRSNSTPVRSTVSTTTTCSRRTAARSTPAATTGTSTPCRSPARPPKDLRRPDPPLLPARHLARRSYAGLCRPGERQRQGPDQPLPSAGGGRAEPPADRPRPAA